MAKSKQSEQTRRAIANGTYVPGRRNPDNLWVSCANARERSKNRDRDAKDCQRWRNRHRPDLRHRD